MREDVISPYLGLKLLVTKSYANRHGAPWPAATRLTVTAVNDWDVEAEDSAGHNHSISRSDLIRSNFRELQP